MFIQEKHARKLLQFFNDPKFKEPFNEWIRDNLNQDINTLKRVKDIEEIRKLQARIETLEFLLQADERAKTEIARAKQ